METTALAGIRSNPSFISLVKRRSRFVALLTAATLVPYYTFIFIAGFNPQWLAGKVFNGSMVNVGWLAGVVLIVGVWLLTGLYVMRANREFDDLTAQILAGVKK